MTKNNNKLRKKKKAKQQFKKHNRKEYINNSLQITKTITQVGLVYTQNTRINQEFTKIYKSFSQEQFTTLKIFTEYSQQNNQNLKTTLFNFQFIKPQYLQMSQTLQKLHTNQFQGLKKCGDDSSSKNCFFGSLKQMSQSREQQCLKERLSVCTGELKHEIERFDDLCNPGMISAAYCDECERIMENFQN